MSITDWFTADLHLGHKLVAQHRGYLSTGHHDWDILNTLSNALKPGDRLWILGDISGGKHEEEALRKLVILKSDTKASFHLISGNHDSIHPMHRKAHLQHPDFRMAFDSTDSLGTFRHNKDKVMLSHFPYTGDRGKERYPEYRLNDCGKPLIHGHTHFPYKLSYSTNRTLQINVGLDAWDMKPARKEDLVKLIDPHKEAHHD